MNVLRIGRVLPGVALLCLLASCGSEYNKSSLMDEAYVSADSVAYAYDPVSSKLPETRMMARKAHMNFKVKELQKTSQKISSITAQCGGEIWNSHIQTDIQNRITKQISADSLLEVITHRQTNELTIRVPSQNLDSLLFKLEGLSELLHEKQVVTENVSLEYLSNELKAKNRARSQGRIEEAMDTKKSNLEKYSNTESANIDLQDNVIDRQVQNMALLDKVNFSTVTVSIYQDSEAYTNVVANLNSDRFGPGFGSSAIMAAQDGWEFMLSLVIFLIRIWPLYLIVIGIFFLIRYVDKFRPKVSKVIIEK